jgi:hypothetical protein
MQTSQSAPPAGRHEAEAPDVLGPLLSTAIFGYFGFMAGLATGDGSGTVPLYLTTVWVLRVSAILFLGCAVVAMMRFPRAGLLAGVAGGIATLGLAVVMAWSIADPERDIAVHPLIMILCILWNGYGSFTAIRAGLR